MSGKRGKFDPKRGRHKKRTSAETKAWNAEHLPPEPGPSIDAETAQRLREFRRTLDPLGS